MNLSSRSAMDILPLPRGLPSRPTERRSISWAYISALTFLATALLVIVVLPASAQADEPESVPVAPDKLTGKPVYAGIVYLEWNDAPGATRYGVQRFDPTTYDDSSSLTDEESENNGWLLLPDGDPGIEVAFDGPRAVIRNLPQQNRLYFRVRAVNAHGTSDWSETLSLPATGPQGSWEGVPELTNEEIFQQESEDNTCPGADLAPTPSAVEVGAVPIVVESTSDKYFVLYVRPDIGSDREIPVSVTLGQDGTTTLTEQLRTLPKEHYRVEEFLIVEPADIDGDCIDDITELQDPAGMNPLNPAPALSFDDGVAAIPDDETFETLSFKGVVKLVLFGMNTDRPPVFFQNTETHKGHFSVPELARLGLDPLNHGGYEGMIDAEMVFEPNVAAPDGSLGVYRFELMRPAQMVHKFEYVSYAYEILTASMPVLNNNLVYHPSIRGASEAYQDQKALYDSSRLNVLKGGEIVLSDFISFNRGEGFGFLRVMSLEERPNPHDIVIYETLPNELSRVAGIITTVPQTPLSHVNLRAVQDGVPNAFIRDALDDADIDDLIGSYIRYEVTDDGYTIRAATPEEVDAHYAASRPSETQTPERDLSATQITDLDEIEFEDWNVFGVKAANVAVLRTLGFPDGIVPDGFAVPFYFYDEFMKHNGLYNEIEEMLADSDFQSDYDEQESELKKLRKKIKKGETPEWIITALTTMHATYPDGQSLRYRSSTNNEDLPGFSGAGLYDSKTQKPDETEEDGIDKSLKQVYASLWNFRAFTEREFHRIDHSAAAMGVLVHPNYSDELANGVAVSFNPIRNRYGSYYVNTQIGEDLVTNPEAHSVPEEILLYGVGAYRVLAYSNQAENGELLMSDSQLEQLRSHLEVIHDEFKELYDIEAGEPFAMEVEFKITSDNVLSIKQARPWVFGDGASPPNHPAAGLPTISGTAQAGQTLTAVTSDIDDADGLDNVSYSYQWLAGNTFIEDSTGSTYKVSEDDVGKTIEVRVSFTDDRNNAETLTSEATATVVVNTNSPATGLPTITGTAQVGQTLTADITAIADSDGLTNVSYSYQWLAGGSDIDGATGSTYDVSDDDVGKTIKVRVSFTDDAGNEETLTSAAPAEVAAKPNSPATGQPTISGTAQVGETLTASTLGVADADGLDNATFAYQWIAGGSDIDGATGSTYELSDADVGKTIKVRVSFTDDADNQETLTSAATAVVAAEGTVPGPPGHLRVFPHDAQGLDTSWEAPASNGGSSITGYTVQWKEVDDSWDTPADVSQETVSGTTHTISGLTDGVEYAVRVIASNEVGNGAPSAEETGTPRETTPPQIVMLRVDGATLRMSYDEDLDEESTPPADAFVVKVVPRHGDKHWQDEDARRMVESVQVTGDTVVLTLASAVTSEDYVVIRYNPPSDEASPRIRDAVGNAAAGFGSTEVFNDTEEAPAEQEGQHESGQNSPATGALAITGTAQVDETLTADTAAIDDADGLDNSTFSYKWMAGEADIDGATGSSYTLTSSEEGKTIKVRVTFTDDAGNEETLTSAATAEVVVAPNSPATGAPTISGTAQVEETLTASTLGVADADGLSNTTFSYQWVANDGGVDTDIAGATSATYELQAADEGKTVQVRVSFTDDAGHKESLTSAATAAVAARPNNPATGSPTISGTAQVGETLAASTTGIADSDGLTNVNYRYQWLADGADINGATGSGYTLTASEQGKTVQVRVSFTDDAGSKESLTSAATAAVAAKPALLTVSLENNPASHDGQAVFTFELRFSEHIADLSYKILRDQALTVTGGQVKKAQRMDPDSETCNIHWRITVQPDGNGDVTIVLPVTTDCDAQGAICTGDGRKLSNRLEFTVSGPGG